ncbi:hypothetical protein TNCV_4491601 [Trichonephila clavipes]|nr:hypothetical protein TNCV_4491601 [Trichonephila clavipes]
MDVPLKKLHPERDQEERFQGNMYRKKSLSEKKTNHSGSAGKMEVCGMQKIFLRSEQKHRVKYQRYIDDGDSKTFLSIAEKNHMGIVFPL